MNHTMAKTYLINIGIVHPKKKIIPQEILGVYDFQPNTVRDLYPGSSQLYNGSEWYLVFLSPKKHIHPS